MALYLGRGACIGLAEESTWGTAVARARWARVASASTGRTRPKVVVPHLHDASVAMNPRHFFVERDRVRASVSFPAYYDSYVMTALIKHAMGANVDAGAGPYTHTATCAADLPTGLTVELVQGTGFGEVLEGCKVSRLTIGAQYGQVVTVSADLIAQTTGGPVSAASPTLVGDPVWIQHHHASTLAWNSLTLRLKSWSLVIDNAIGERDGLGDLTTLEPARTGIASMTMSIELERDADGLHSGYLADTQSDAVISFTSGAHSIAITLHNALLETHDSAPSGVGPVPQRATLRGYRDSSDGGLSIVTTNTLATAV